MQLNTGALQGMGRQIVSVDSHTAGEPTRLVIGGVPPLPGATINEKRLYLQKHHDDVRLLLTREPRGHRDMFAAVVTEPVSAEGNFGLIYMDARRYPFMCGHATLGAVTTFLEMGWLRVPEGSRERTVVVDTPSGPVRAQAQVGRDKEGRMCVESVAMRLMPSFVHDEGLPVTVTGAGTFLVDVVCVGGYFAMVSAEQIELALTAENAGPLAELGMAIIDAANEQVQIAHPTRPHVNTIDVTEFYGKDDAGQSCNAVVYGESHVDRSPCGTGTSAKMALLHRRGELAVGDEFVNAGLLGTRFVGRIVEETSVGPYPAIVPEIRGRANITGLHRFVVTEEDPFAKGFLFS